MAKADIAAEVITGPFFGYRRVQEKQPFDAERPIDTKDGAPVASVQAWKNACDCKAYMDNVKKEKFGIDFVAGFDLVMNALDNVSARSHVNRLCLATNVPLVESGTTGHLGQMTCIVKGETECYDCQPKPKQKKVCI